MSEKTYFVEFTQVEMETILESFAQYRKLRIDYVRDHGKHPRDDQDYIIACKMHLKLSEAYMGTTVELEEYLSLAD